jgi:hypothetical protein
VALDVATLLGAATPSAGAARTSAATTARTSLPRLPLPRSPFDGLLAAVASAGGAGSALLFALLASALALVAPRLGRWLRPMTDLAPPTALAFGIERPG